MKKLFKIFGILVAVVLVLIILFLIASFVPLPGNFKVFNVLTGSMEPAIKTGSLVIVKPAPSYQVGDVVTFGESSETKTPITHRIKEMKVESGEAIFITKGDANQTQDLTEVRQSAVLGKVVFSVPFVGTIIKIVKTPIGFLIIVVIPAIIFIYEELKKVGREFGNLRKKNPEVSAKNNSETEIK